MPNLTINFSAIQSQETSMLCIFYPCWWNFFAFLLSMSVLRLSHHKSKVSHVISLLSCLALIFDLGESFSLSSFPLAPWTFDTISFHKSFQALSTSRMHSIFQFNSWWYVSSRDILQFWASTKHEWMSSSCWAITKLRRDHSHQYGHRGIWWHCLCWWLHSPSWCYTLVDCNLRHVMRGGHLEVFGRARLGPREGPPGVPLANRPLKVLLIRIISEALFLQTRFE